MDDYPSNSHKSKAQRMEPVPEKKKIEKIIDGAVKQRSKNGLQKFADALISDSVDDLRHYILMDVILPKARDMIHDAIVNTADAVFYGKNGDPRKKSSYQASYRSYYDDSRRETNRDWRRERRDYEDFIFSNRGEAEKVLAKMDELIDMYGMVSVADLWELVGLSGDYTDNKYGWTSIRAAGVIRVRDGYILKLPKAIPLD